MCSREGFEKYLLNDVELTLRHDITKKVIYKRELNEKHSSNYWVLKDGEIVKIKYNELLKPNRECGLFVKPQDFGITGNYNTPDEIALTVYNNLDNISDYNRRHIILLLAKYSKIIRDKFKINNIDGELEKYSDNPRMSELIKDFSEILGVLYINKNEIYFPECKNYPLVDYFISGKAYSAKSLSQSNTVKFQNLIKYIPEKLDNHFVSKIIKDYDYFRKDNSVKISNRLLTIKYSEGFYTSPYKFWTNFSNENSKEITDFYNQVTKGRIETITAHSEKGCIIVKKRLPCKVQIKLKEYKESIGFSQHFNK